MKCMATPPQLKCMQLTCATDAPPIKYSGSDASSTVASQPSYCEARLNKEVKSERKRCPSFNRRHTARNPLNRKRALMKRSKPRFYRNDTACPMEATVHGMQAAWRRRMYTVPQKQLLFRLPCYMCAQQAGLYMKMEAAGAGRDPSQPVQVAKMAYCDTHTPAHVLQERRALESDNDSKSSDLSAIRQKGREKIKQARRVLAMKRTWAPVVLVPTLPAERVAEIAELAGSGPSVGRAQLMKRLLAYWTLKRHSRNGAPLLRRLQTLATNHGTRAIQDGTVNVRELCNQLKYWQRIRQDLERARLLCELVRKRERLKAEYTRVWERCLMHTMKPHLAALQKLIRLLHSKDTSDIFSEPVDPTEIIYTLACFSGTISGATAKRTGGAMQKSLAAAVRLAVGRDSAFNGGTAKQCQFIGVSRRFYDSAHMTEMSKGPWKMVPDYSTIVKHPMDLSTMAKKLECEAYTTIDDIEADFRLMIDNCLVYNNKDTVFYKAGIKMRDQCLPIFRQARRDVRAAGMPALAGEGDCRESSPEPEKPRVRTRERSMSRPRAREPSVDSNTALAESRNARAASTARGEWREPSPRAQAPPRRSVARSDTERDSQEVYTQYMRQLPRCVGYTQVCTYTRLKSERCANKLQRDESPLASRGSRWWRGRGRGRGRRGRRGRGRPALQRHLGDRVETPTSDSETPAPSKKSPERTARSPEKSPAKAADTTPTGLGLLSLRKPTLLANTSTAGSAGSQMSFGSDAALPTLSASLGRTPLEASPKKKGRGRPRKHDKEKATSSPDLFRPARGEEATASKPVSASFLQYRGAAGEVGSESDLSGSSSSSAWSCSSCTHYDELSDHSCSTSSSEGDGSSYNETMDSNLSGPNASEADRRRRSRRAPSSEHSEQETAVAPVKGRGTRSSTSKTPAKSSSQLDLQLEPLQLVWAKCRGYPWYPALIIDPKMPKGFVYKGVPLPVPPQDVLNLKSNHSHEPVLYLVLFFDVKRTWQWLPPNKLELLGIDKSIDQGKLIESRKPTDRKAVKKAFNDAMQFRKQVDGNEK
ncbi:Peregrin [Eumeta japonica]|uniref:Peregrin n=1 Tax=Eumeta variegata TaxID=151549 RepID=A0A4C1UL55_EUMVA|nr:Peregrin [Eumeta japonica]